MSNAPIRSKATRNARSTLRTKAMRLTPIKLDRLTLFTPAELARRRCARGLRLTHPEALAIICDEMHVRKGKKKGQSSFRSL